MKAELLRNLIPISGAWDSQCPRPMLCQQFKKRVCRKSDAAACTFGWETKLHSRTLSYSQKESCTLFVIQRIPYIGPPNRPGSPHCGPCVNLKKRCTLAEPPYNPFQHARSRRLRRFWDKQAHMGIWASHRKVVCKLHYNITTPPALPMRHS